MKIETMTVIPSPGNFVAINGEGYRCKPITIEGHPLYGAVHALQWFGEHGGQIEYAKGPAGGLKLDAFEPYIAPWRKARAEALKIKHDDLTRNLDHVTQRIADHKVMIGHIDEQIPDLAAQIKKAGKVKPGGIVNARARLANTLARMKAELMAMESSRGDLAASHPFVADAAEKAAVDVTSPVKITRE